MLYYNKKHLVELRHCEKSSSYRVYYLYSDETKNSEGKVIFYFRIRLHPIKTKRIVPNCQWQLSRQDLRSCCVRTQVVSIRGMFPSV